MADSYQVNTKKHGVSRRQIRRPSHCGCGATARLLLNKGSKVSHGTLAVLQLPRLNLTAIKEQTAAIILSLSWLL